MYQIFFIWKFSFFLVVYLNMRVFVMGLKLLFPRSALHQLLSHITKSTALFSEKDRLSRVHPPKTHTEVGCIHMMRAQVYLGQYSVKACLIWIISFAIMRQEIFIVYAETCTMCFDKAGFKESAIVSVFFFFFFFFFLSFCVSFAIFPG